MTGTLPNCLLASYLQPWTRPIANSWLPPLRRSRALLCSHLETSDLQG
ncbi:hypothetical protein LEMLEM_LOCUS1664 [Lemmus lemmus]